MGRLYQKFRNALGNETPHGLFHIVDSDSILFPQFIDDNLAGKGPALFIIRIRGGQDFFYGPDGFSRESLKLVLKLTTRRTGFPSVPEDGVLLHADKMMNSITNTVAMEI
jgi:hypothetical protein